MKAYSMLIIFTKNNDYGKLYHNFTLSIIHTFFWNQKFNEQ